MTLIALTDCCHLLAIDAKTLRRWLAQAQLISQPHPGDARLKGVTGEQLRMLATAHHRSLPTLPGELATLAPTGPAPEPVALPPELLALLQTLSALPAQLAAVQQHLAALQERLAAPPLPPPVPASPAPQDKARMRSRPSAPPAARARPATALATARPRPSAHVLPLVEYVHEGHYVVICPTAGLLPFEPETPAWFAWLATQSSFRFVGRSGHFTAHHEWRVPRGAWRAHRKIRNHGSTLRLAPTPDLTIAVLEQVAATLQAHLL